MSDPVVLICPAMAVSSRFYGPVVEAFADRGWEALALPRRGFERGRPTAGRGVDWSYDHEISDIADAVSAARREAPDRPVLLLAHSLGAQLAAGHQLHRDPADALVVVGASVPHARYYPMAGLPVRVLASLVPVVVRVRGFLPRPFFGGPGAATMMREWAHMARTGKPPFAVQHRIATPTLDIRLEGDTYAVPAANQQFVDLFVEPSSMSRRDYTRDAVPDGGTTHHIHWVRTPRPLVDMVIDWWRHQADRQGAGRDEVVGT